MAGLVLPNVTVRPVDWRTADDHAYEVGHVVETTIAREVRPDEPGPPFDLYRTAARTLPAMVSVWTWVAHDADGAPAALGYCHYAGPENPHLIRCEVQVMPGHRRRGLGRQLLSLIADVAEAEGRTTMLASTWDVVPAGAGFARAAGGTPGRVQRESAVSLLALDRQLLATWSAEGPVRAPGYELVLYDTSYPHDDEDELRRIAHAHDAMNGAPRDDLPMEDRVRTVEELVQWDRAEQARGDERWELLARHKESGEYVGFTNLVWSADNPSVVRQGGTAVHVEHRGHALGKWLKAAMLEKVLADRPEAKVIRTVNAYSNEPMLGINVALGFEVVRSVTDWTLPLERVRAFVGA